MRGITLAAKMRGVSRALGIEVQHGPGPSGWQLFAFDPTLDKAWPDVAKMEGLRKFEVHYSHHTQAEGALKRLHSFVYRARGEEVYLRQNGLCCFCGRKMSITRFEIDHKKSRGAHGRQDAIDNLQACCTGMEGCGTHRRKHGG